MNFVTLLSFTLLNLLHFTSGENILFFWAVSGTSHRISVWPLVEKLADNGHNITFFSPIAPKKPNAKVHEIVVDSLMKDSGLDVDFLKARILGGTAAISKLWRKYFDFAIYSCKAIVENPVLVEWIKQSSYDLVIINAMFNDCGYGLAYKFNAPHIIYSPTHTFGWFSEMFGYPDENYPEFQFHYPEDMNFLQSVHNALQPLYWQWNRLSYVYPRVEDILKNGLNLSEMPPLAEIQSNVSLVFVNTHFSEEYPRSLPPLVVPIGGMHCVDDVKPLSEELERFVNTSDEGFVYFSFGTFANTLSLPERIVASIFNAMGNLTAVQFLVKWVDNSYKGILPKNVKLLEWFDQQDVLGHSRIRAFISHGGLLSTQEALYHGVPTIVIPLFAEQSLSSLEGIVIPLFAEQDYNAERVHSRGRGLKLDIGDLTQNNLMDAIHEILQNSSYIENTKKASILFKDRPMKTVDMAVWWVEYVLRHKDAANEHLQPIGLKRNWLQRRMLDIWFFLAGCAMICTVIAITVIFLSLKSIIRYNYALFPRKEKLS